MSMSPTHPIVFESLRQSAIAFEDNLPTRGFSEFHTVCVSSKKAECGVYEKLWEILKKPLGDSEYGRSAFHNANGKYSTPEQKADAITRYMIVNKMIPSELVVLNSKTNFYSLSEKAVKILENADEKLTKILNWEPKNPTAKIPFKLFKISMKIASLFICAKAGYKITSAVTSGLSGRMSIPNATAELGRIDSTGRTIVGSMQHFTSSDKSLALLNRYDAINAARLDALPHDPNYDNPRVNFRHKKQDTREYSCEEEKRHRQKADKEGNKATNEQGRAIRSAGDGDFGQAADHQKKAIRHKFKSDSENRKANDAMYNDAQEKIRKSREEGQAKLNGGCIVM